MAQIVFDLQLFPRIVHTLGASQKKVTNSAVTIYDFATYLWSKQCLVDNFHSSTAKQSTPACHQLHRLHGQSVKVLCNSPHSLQRLLFGKAQNSQQSKDSCHDQQRGQGHMPRGS
jgi:hypothetical protein